MAACSSDDSSGAPDNFQISSSNGDSDSNLNDSPPRCPLCLISNRNYYCRNCVQSGDFVHSAHRLSESLKEKRHKLQNIKASLKKSEERCEQHLQRKKLEENLKLEIEKKKERIGILQRQSQEKRVFTEERKKHKKQTILENRQKTCMLPKYEDKVRTLGDYVSDRVQQNVVLREKLNDIHNQLKQKIRNDVKQLIKFIFPIVESIPKHEPTDTASVCDTVAALAEATNTAYIRGKWVFQDSINNELQHIIVGPSLPANGDYSAYLDWIAHNKDGATATTTTETLASTHPPYRISGALTYTAQLVNILCFYADVRLPNKLAYSEFCRKELSEQQFNRKVSRLNTNIMYLAYTQHVKLRLLNPNQTLINLLEILNVSVSDLGRVGPVEVAHAPLVRSIDSQVLIDLETGTESESDDESSLRQEWESVPHFYQSHDTSPPLPMAAAVPPPAPNPQQAASIAGGLVTSAAASIASIFRGWTTGR